MIINYTAHVIAIYAPQVPDVIAPAMPGHAAPAWRPLLVIPQSGHIARITEHEVETRPLKGAEALPGGVSLVKYDRVELPPVRDRQWVVVSLACALALPMRPDLLVPWRQVRDASGATIGCRGLARPA